MAKPSYLEASRRLAASVVFITPLVAVYEAGVALDSSARNGADPILRGLFHRVDYFGLLFFNLLLLGLLCIAIWRTKAKRIRVPGLYGRMFLESLAWSSLMLACAHLPFDRLALPGFGRDLVASAGAGVYEEILFRFLLMGGLVLMLERGMGGNRYWVLPLAIVASALLFSLAHHTIGGEEFERGVFLFRAFMGCLLGLVYWTRGLGIVVYAHTFYNVAVVTLRQT